MGKHNDMMSNNNNNNNNKQGATGVMHLSSVASRGKQGGVDDRLTLVRVRVRVRTLVPWFSPTTKAATTLS